MLIGTRTRKIELPHEDGAWIEVRDLTRKEIAESKRLKLKDLLDTFGDNIEAFMGQTPDPNAKVTIESYDIDHVLQCAVKGWSYEEKFDAGLIDQLDNVTAEFLANELLGIEVEGEKVKG